MQELFNPRLREGGDKRYMADGLKYVTFSIHASAKEATPMREIWGEELVGFSIHASAKEATAQKVNSEN